MTTLTVTAEQINVVVSEGVKTQSDLQVTTMDLINGSYDYEAGVVVTTSGFYEAGDGGAAQWKVTETSGLAPSQTPADRGAAELVDGEGRLLNLVYLSAPLLLELNPVHLGCASSFGSDSSAHVQAAINSLSSKAAVISSSYPGGVPSRSLSGRLILDGLNISIGNTLDMSGCHGVEVSGGSLLADNSLTGSDPVIYAFQTQGLKIRGLKIQCNFISSGVYLLECPLHEIDDVSIYGCGKQDYGIRVGPVSYSASGVINECKVFGWRTFHTELLPSERVSKNIWVENNDIQVSGCYSAAGLCCIWADGGGLQINNNHIWNGFPSDNPSVAATTTKPLGVYANNENIISISNNYIDNCVVWVKPRLKSITDNYFLAAGDLDIDCAIVFESSSEGYSAVDTVVTNNLLKGPYDKFIELIQSSGLFGAQQRVVVSGNTSGASGSGYGPMVSTLGVARIAVDGSDFDSDNRVSISLSDELVFPSTPAPLLSTLGVRLYSVTSSSVSVEWYQWDPATSEITIKCTAPLTGEIIVNYDHSGSNQQIVV